MDTTQFVATAALSLTATALLAETAPRGLFGLRINEEGDGIVYRLCPATGAATPVAEIADLGIGLVATDFLGNTLWASTLFSNMARSAEKNGPKSGDPCRPHDEMWAGFAYDPADPVFYTVSLDAPNQPLLRVLPCGCSHPVGNTSQTILALAHDSCNRTLWGISDSDLFTLDTETGAATHIGTLGFSTADAGLAWDDESETLYLNTGSLSDQPNRLFRVDTATGEAILIGPNRVGGIGTLAFQRQTTETSAPEPACVAQLVSKLALTGLGYHPKC